VGLKAPGVCGTTLGATKAGVWAGGGVNGFFLEGGVTGLFRLGGWVWGGG
jgi:hypothetical protein